MMPTTSSSRDVERLRRLFLVSALALAASACRREGDPPVRADDAAPPRASASTTLPSASATLETTAPNVDDGFQVVVTRKRILIDGVEAPKSEIPKRAAAALAVKPGIPGILLAEPEIPYSEIIEVMDLLREGGIVDIRFLALQKAKK